MEQQHLTPAMVRILQVYLQDPATPLYATELMKAAAIGSGSLYPALTRLRAAEWIVEEKEDIDPHQEGRPARRYFQMTGKGALEAHRALVELSQNVRPPAGSPAWTPGWQPDWRITTVLRSLTGLRLFHAVAKGLRTT
ncbi:PadR family transcriptional regulator [Streptomyces sp. NPDC096057]|uniref:PadR family transcriptional regulator n=1 Tax=Streptomyces sp. NPDC096057 TaxID=3155543 RepID=UPI00331F4DFF